MTLEEVLSKLDRDVRNLIPISSSTGKSTNGSATGTINLKETIAIGQPHFDTYVDKSLGISFNDANFIAFVPFIILQPLDINFSKLKDLFSLTANLFELQKDLPSLALFASKDSSFTIEVTNTLDTSFFEEIMNVLSKFGDVAQTFGFAQGISELVGSVGNLADKIGATPIASAMYALAGFKFSGPKIWKGGEVETSIRVNVVHDFSLEGYDEEKIHKIFSTIKLFTVPRNPSKIANPSSDVQKQDEKQEPKINTQQNPEQSSVQGQLLDKESVESLSKLMYKYPLFCRVIHGNTGKVIYDVALVTNFSTSYNFLNTDTLTFRQIPSTAEFSFTITPLLPFRSDTASNSKIDDSYPVTSVEKLFDSIVRTGFTGDNNKVKTVRKVLYNNIIRNGRM